MVGIVTSHLSPVNFLKLLMRLAYAKTSPNGYRVCA
jgi:hypothetical protein